MNLGDVLQLMELEYQEMPELKLTFWQAQHLWDLSSDVCESALAALVRSGFLTRSTDGAYVRRMARRTRGVQGA
jgi:hypothetical protein